MSSCDKHSSSSGGASKTSRHHKSKKGLAKRAKSFKEDFFEKISQIGRGSSPSSRTTSSANLLGADLLANKRSSGRNHSISSLTPARDQEEAAKRDRDREHHRFIHADTLSSPNKSSCGSRSDLTFVINPSSSPPASSSSLISKDLTNAYNFVKKLNSSLRYLTDVVEKNKLEQLPGAASVLLEIVVSGYAELRPHLSCQKQR